MVGRVFPLDGPRPTSSTAERKLYDALTRHLPAGWTAWHSLRLRVGGGYEGEGDFVIAIPERGILLVEVKGGHVELCEGQWLQDGRALKRAPLDQARSFAGHLDRELRERGARVPPWGVAGAFPQTAFSAGPEEGGCRGLILGERDLDWLDAALRSVAERAISIEQRRVSPMREWVPQLEAIWGRTWVPRVSLDDRADDEERRRIALDRDQLRVLDLVEANARVLVEGGAGSGKTVVAREKCVRHARAGGRALYACFTDALGYAVDRSFEPLRREGLAVHAAPIERLAADWMRQKGKSVPPVEAEGWKDVTLRATDYLPPEEERPDLVVVDEAQDFSEQHWLFIDEIATGQGLWIFHDPRQRFWGDRILPEGVAADAMKLTLPTQHRNPPGVERLAARYRDEGAAHDSRKRDKFDSVRVVAVSEGKAVLDRVRHELDQLRRDGARPGDIAVLTVGGRKRSELMQRIEGGLASLGGHALALADDPTASERVVADTFLRFKGLERPYVIVTELEAGRSSKYATRMHIATSRATVELVIVATMAELEADPRLAGLG